MLFLREKINEAISFIREHEPEEGYSVKFSGGKDSIVTLDLVKQAGVKYVAYYNYTSIDPPEVTRFILKHYPHVKWLRPGRNFFKWVERIGPPTKVRRWCCSKLKHRIHTKLSKCVILGVRAEESYRRARRSMVNKNAESCTTDYYPIFNFNEAEVWEYIEDRGLAYPSLYDEGFSRIGCVICPFVCRPGMIETHKNRWPEMYRLFERSVQKYYLSKQDWYRENGVYSAEQLLASWYSSELSTKVEEEEGSLSLF